MRRLTAVLLAVSLGLGCLTNRQAPRLYTPDMRPSGKAQCSGCYLKVERLRTTDSLTRSNILIRKRPTQIEYYAFDEWAGRLDELVAQKLQVEFGTRHSTETILISGTILAFEQLDTLEGAKAHIRFEIVFRDERMSRDEKPLLEKTYDFEAPVPQPTAAALVEALSRGLEAIAAQIVADAPRATPIP